MAATTDEFWTSETIDFLIDRRVARDAVFKTTNSDKIGWLQILSDLRKAGAPKSLNRVNVRRQWFKICENYKKYCENKKNGNNSEQLLPHFSYYAKLDKFFNKQVPAAKHFKHEINDDKQNLTSKFLAITQYADRWPQERTNLLIEARVSRNSFFVDTRRGSANSAWEAVLSDLVSLGEPTTLTVPQIKKKWENLCTRYKVLKDKKIFETKWPYFKKLDDFFSVKHQEKNAESEFGSQFLDTACYRMSSEENTSKFRQRQEKCVIDKKNHIYADRWPSARTKLLIERRIARNAMFDGRGLSSNAWQAIVTDLKEAGASEDLTFSQVKKKWENLCTRYKILKDNNVQNTTWPYFKLMDNFLGKKYKMRAKKLINKTDDEASEEKSDENSVEFLEWKEKEEKKTKMCRLCQEMTGDFSLAEDQDLCQRIKLCTSIEVSLNLDHLPSSVCSSCKILTNQFFDFRLRCCEVDKKLRSSCRFFNPVKAENEDSRECFILSATEETSTISEKNQKIKKLLHTCEICSATFEKRSQLYSHVKLHFEIHSGNGEEHEEGKDKDVKYLKSLAEEEMTDSGNLQDEDGEDEQETCKLNQNMERKKSRKTEYLQNRKWKIECQASQKVECLQNEVVECGKVLEEEVKYQESKDEGTYRTEGVEWQKHQEINRQIGQRNEDMGAKAENEEEEFSRDLDSDSGSSQKIIDEESAVEQEVEDRKYSSCPKAFVQESCFRNQSESHSKTVHECHREGCNKKYTTLYALRNHERKHLGLHPFLCFACGKGFVTNNALKFHEKTHSAVKEHVCPACSRGFSELSNMRAHHKKHHEGHRFYCSQCPKQFLTKSSLQRHELVHTGFKEFVCDVCSSAFYTAKELQKHKRYHEGTRLFHCNQCFKTFYEKHHLTVHIRCHTGERPYVCQTPGCGKAFRESQKLSRHLKTHHRTL